MSSEFPTTYYSNQSAQLDARGGSIISGMGVQIYKGDSIS